MKNLNYVQQRLAQVFKNKMFEGGESRGIFCAPTGTGKTGTARAMLNLFADRFFSKGVGSGYSFFLTPRIALTDQQATALKNFRIAGNTYPDVEILIHRVHSVGDGKTAEELREAIDHAKSENKYLVFCSTYQSAGSLSKFNPDLIICDEAHNLVSEKFNETVMETLSAKAIRVFLTATPKEVKGENTPGFNNAAMYGNYMSQIAPRRAIEERLIISPRLHIFKANSDHKQHQTLISQVIHIFKNHRAFNPHIWTKVLYAMDGTEPVDTVRKFFETIHEHIGVKVFTIVSTGECNGAYIDGKKYDREEFFDIFNKYEGNAIMAHYRIVSEGIDLPSLTGVAFFRSPSLIDTVQTVGRCIRIHDLDRDEQGIAKPLIERIKKYGLVTVVVYNSDTSIKEAISPFVKSMRSAGFDFFRESILVSHERSNTKENETATDSMIDFDEEPEDISIQYDVEDAISEIEEAEMMEEMRTVKPVPNSKWEYCRL